MVRERHTDIVIVGGGTGGCAAALAALRLGTSVIMTEETEWVGGQFTSQAVPPDEHAWIEHIPPSTTYGALRQKIRDFYVRNFPLSDQALRVAYFNPGNGGVGPLCCEPRAALAA